MSTGLFRLNKHERGVLCDMTPIIPRLSAKFSNMAFVCACLVVCQHLSYDHTLCGGWVFQILFYGLPKAAVPFFFLTSGFFLAGKLAQSGGGHFLELKKRVRSLFVPYLLWSVIWMAFISSMIWYSGSNLWPSVWAWLGLDFTAIPAFGPLWFLRNLMLLVLLSPVLFYGVKTLRAWFVAIIFAIEFVFTLFSISNDFLCWTFRLSAMAYFCLGAYLRSNPVHIDHSNSVGIISLLLSMALVVISRSSVSAFFFVPLFMLGLWLVMPNKLLVEWLAFTAFPIYLIHPFVIKLWGSVFGRTRLEVWLLPFQYFTSIGISIAVAMLFKAKFRRLGTILFGGRV